MVYVVGFIGLIFGFGMGQALLFFLLRDVPKEDLLEDETIKYKYGLLNWIVAVFGAYLAVSIYNRYFLDF